MVRKELVHDWNVIITIHEGQFREAIRFLGPYGRLGRTDYFNVLVMKVGDTGRLLDDLAMEFKAAPFLAHVLSRIMPATHNFDFQQPAEFELRAREAVAPWVPQLADSRFHVRMHRRGFKERLSSQQEEQFLDRFLMEKLAEQDAAASIDFDDPDYIIDIETVGQRAGIALWTREQRLRYPFLKLD